MSQPPWHQPPSYGPGQRPHATPPMWPVPAAAQYGDPVPLPYPPAAPSPGQPRWLLPVAVLALVCSLTLTSVGFWYVYTRYIATDPGVAMCEELRDSAADASGGRRESDIAADLAEHERIRGQFDGSRHDDVREAGTAYMDTAYRLYNKMHNGKIEDGDWQVLPAAMTDLQGACANHGVTITIDWD